MVGNHILQMTMQNYDCEDNPIGPQENKPYHLTFKKDGIGTATSQGRTVNFEGYLIEKPSNIIEGKH